MLTLTEVEALARQAHATQTDKAGHPYTEHLQAVADGVKAHNGTEEQIAAAWLHDAIEDNALSEEWLTTAPLTDHTKAMIRALTKQKGEDPETYAHRILATPGARLIKEADLAHNTNPARLATLDEPTRTRLTRKYAKMRTLLGLAPETNPEKN
ncbi:HD domain-containing protein [Streptomyces sp. NPDC057694]|uniref:HD domain-containing protein n=1 Tax=Streptomyces sp. NPDC057694 TaxID=3346216 RepID=UPI0036AE31CF